jgi:N-formylglutamate deformylase
MNPFNVHRGHGAVPIIVSVPHCGTKFPDELKDQYHSDLISFPDDTDWFVDELYSFAPELGMTMITAEYSRWVIDLNRPPDSTPLYSDGRILTGLCPTTTFLGEPLYKDHRREVTVEDTQERLAKYYFPYHKKLEELIQETKARFEKVLLWDCHSIRHFVKTIQSGRFPDLNLGDNDQKSAPKELIDIAVETLRSDKFSFSHNAPFKGGYITRHYGNPAQNEFALQLEMNKINYMDDKETKYDISRAQATQDLLKKTFERLIDLLSR